MPQPAPDRIDQFAGDYVFLSNFSYSPIIVDGIKYPTLEHAFQAAKTHDESLRRRIAELDTPRQAKRAGRSVQLREGWDEIRVEVMRELLRCKFAPGSPLAARLLATGDAELVEGNHWGDRLWGVCRGEGDNRLGKLLMELREQLRAHQAQPSPGSCERCRRNSPVASRPPAAAGSTRPPAASTPASPPPRDPRRGHRIVAEQPGARGLET